MKMRWVLSFVMAGIVQGAVWGQLSLEHNALHALTKNKWEKAQGQLHKALRKDSLNAAAHYGLSLYFSIPANPRYNIDSAYRYINKAIRQYFQSPVKQQDRWRRLPMDSSILKHRQEHIDSAAFDRAIKQNTEAAYIYFINQFTTSYQLALAGELRDEVAYLDALKENTYQSFLAYLTKYPTSVRSAEAKTRYEKLLFEAKTKDKRLASYRTFLEEYPATPYRKVIDQQIFEIMTASGYEADFENFITTYPSSSKIKTSLDILFHLYREEDNPNYLPPTDSLRLVEELNNGYLVPFLKTDKFGFMNDRGEDIPVPHASELNDAYRCGNIIEELLWMDDKIVGRNGNIIFQGVVEDMEDFGYGFMKITSQNCQRVFHYSGFQIGSEVCAEGAKMLGKNFIALQQNDLWSVWTLTGRMLLPFEWEDIQFVGGVVAFKKNGKYKLARVNDIARTADRESIAFYKKEVDEIRLWDSGHLWIRVNDLQGVLTSQLQEWIPIGPQEIKPDFFGSISQTLSGYTIHFLNGMPDMHGEQVEINRPWIATKSAGGWQLINPSTRSEALPMDSIGFTGALAVTFSADSQRVYLPTGIFIDTDIKSKVHFVAGKDTTFFLLIEEGEKKKLFSHRGELLFLVTFDHIEYNNEGYFTVYRKEKRGIVSREGKIVVPAEFDAIGKVANGIVPVIRDKKFGAIHLAIRKQVKPEYEKNLIPYNSLYMIAFKKGSYGLIGWDTKAVAPFEFEDIRYWNDSSAWVKKNFNWMLYNFIDKRIVIDKVKKYKWVSNGEDERIVIFQQENTYGVLSSKKGVIIPPTFSDIINVGSAERPFYFTEKHVEEAGIYIVIYYDAQGHQLRKYVYETESYELIYCTDSIN